MYLKKPKASTDPALRSLLQKAVRRGYADVVERTVRQLVALGDLTWLRSRTVVITFEEAWPLAAPLSLAKDHDSKLRALLRVAASRKNKDAAGLGALAFAFYGGDQSMLDLVPSVRLLRLVAEGQDRPPAFFDWAAKQCESPRSSQVVDAAQRYLAAATWGWDKATILAGALLAATSDVPILGSAQHADSPFPFWVALDKHTPQGKAALRKVSSSLGVTYRQVIWSGFYFESAAVSALDASPWFEAERAWRLRKAGLSVSEAAALWSGVSATIEQDLAVESSRLSQQIQQRGSSNALFAH